MSHRSRCARLAVTLALLVLGPRAVICVAEGRHVAIEASATDCCRRPPATDPASQLGLVDGACGEDCRDSLLAFIGTGRPETGPTRIFLTVALGAVSGDDLRAVWGYRLLAAALDVSPLHGPPSLGVVLRC